MKLYRVFYSDGFWGDELGYTLEEVRAKVYKDKPRGVSIKYIEELS